MRQRYLSGLAGFICRWPLALLIAGAVLAAISVFYTLGHLEFKTSRNDLIGRDSEYWRNYSAYAHEFHGEEDYIIVCESGQPMHNQAAIDSLVSELLLPANNPGPHDSAGAQLFSPDDLFYRTDLDALKKWFLYYLSSDDLTQIRDSLKDFKQLLAVLQHRSTLDTFFDAMNRMMMEMEIAPEAKRLQMEASQPTVSGIVTQMGQFNENAAHGELLSPWASAFFSQDMLDQAQEQMQFQGYQTYRKGEMFLLL